MAKRTGHYVVSTHWDREWYESLQNYRFRLVRLLDEVLDTMERDAEFRYYQMDGQSIPIEDYLEIRPEREAQIRRFAEQGRMKIGPWYVLPDEFLVSGESIVRNFQMGLDVAAKFGTPSRAGFVCDLFGHISQLPQILRGFSIDNALLWRGTSETTHGGMFKWQAPDGSEVIAYRFSPKSGYCSYAFKVRRSEQPDHHVTLESAMEGLKELVEFETQRIPTDSFLLFDGGDHLEIEPMTLDILREGNRQLDGVEILFSHLDGFLEDVREQQDRIATTFVGELRDPGEVGDDAWVIPGVLSSRIHLKQANARCENELCQWTEPFSVFAAALGKAYPQGYLRLAWQYLLRNHPHDSICGCSIDQVHKDMEFRFDQCLGIGERVTRDALEYLAGRVQLPELGELDSAVVLFNPTCEAIDGPVDVTLTFPSKIDAIFQEWFGFEQKVGFRLYDGDGKEVPYQLVAQRRDRFSFRRPLRKFPAGESKFEVDITLPAQIPPYGYTTLMCKPVKEQTRHLGSMVVDDHTLENERVRVTVNPNGTIRLEDLNNGLTFDNLLTLEERADIGDGWFHGTAVNDAIYSSIASAADVAITADGFGKATLRICVRMQVPDQFEFGSRMHRSEAMSEFVVTHHVTLRAGADHVEVRSEVDNTIKDHRLRVLFPTGAQADSYLADQAYDVVERPIALRADNARYKEMEVETKPQQTWTAVHDETRGLAVVSTGLPESAVRDLPDRPIALTLLRGFMRTVMTSGEPGGQILGKHEFHYRIVPLDGAPEVSRLTRLGQAHAANLRTVQLHQHDLSGPDAPDPGQRDQPLTQSFMSVSAQRAVITAIHRRTEDERATVRLFNPSGESEDVEITVEVDDLNARLTDLEGKPGDPVLSSGGTAGVSVQPKQIVTVQLR